MARDPATATNAELVAELLARGWSGNSAKKAVALIRGIERSSARLANVITGLSAGADTMNAIIDSGFARLEVSLDRFEA
jgi:hypothetical protein